MIDEDTPEQRAENWKNQANMQLKVFLEKGHNKFYAREARGAGAVCQSLRSFGALCLAAFCSNSLCQCRNH